MLLELLQPGEAKSGEIVVTTFRGWARWSEITAEVDGRIAAVAEVRFDPAPTELVSVAFGPFH